LLQKFAKFLSAQVKIVNNPLESSSADVFAGMNWHGNSSAIGMSKLGVAADLVVFQKS
jgi:hypothetical protein